MAQVLVYVLVAVIAGGAYRHDWIIFPILLATANIIHYILSLNQLRFGALHCSIACIIMRYGHTLHLVTHVVSLCFLLIVAILLKRVIHLLRVKSTDLELLVDIGVANLLCSVSSRLLLGREHSLTVFVARAVRICHWRWLSILSILDHKFHGSTSGLTLYHYFFAAHQDHTLILHWGLRHINLCSCTSSCFPPYSSSLLQLLAILVMNFFRLYVDQCPKLVLASKYANSVRVSASGRAQVRIRSPVWNWGGRIECNPTLVGSRIMRGWHETLFVSPVPLLCMVSLRRVYHWL